MIEIKELHFDFTDGPQDIVSKLNELIRAFNKIQSDKIEACTHANSKLVSIEFKDGNLLQNYSCPDCEYGYANVNQFDSGTTVETPYGPLAFPSKKETE